MAYRRIEPTHFTTEVVELILQRYKKPNLRWPREEFEYGLKEEFQNTTSLRTFKTRIKKLQDLRTQWKPYAQLIDEWKTELHEKIKMLEADSGNLPTKMAELETKLQEDCAHPIQFQEYFESHNDDEYGSHWYTVYWTTCTICGKASSQYIQYRGGRIERKEK